MGTQRQRVLAVMAAAVLAVAPMATACSAGKQDQGNSPEGKPQRGGTLRVARAESFDGWDPDKASAYASYQTLMSVLEPLIRSAPSGKDLEPGIATSWTYDSQKQAWTVRLRDGVKFSDGTPLTAADVVFSAKVWAEGANFGSLYAGIKNVTAPDPATVVFEVAKPDTTLPVLLSWSSSAIFPKDFGGKSQKDYFAGPVGAGGFSIGSWRPGGQIVLNRNEHYYQAGRPYVDKVVIEVVSDANERAVLFQAGQIDISEYVTAIDAPRYNKGLVVLPQSQIVHLSLNVTTPVLGDVSVRRAIAASIDYQGVATGPYRAYGTPAQGIIAPNLANWAAPSKPGYKRDVAQAKRLLAGSQNPKPGPLELVFDSGVPTDSLAAQIVQANLAEAGLTVTLSGLETGAFLDRAYGQSADMVLWSYGAISPDVIDPLGWIIGTSWLFTGASTDRLAEHFEAYAAAPNATEKQKIITRIQDEALDDAAAIPLAATQVLHGARGQVHGFASAPWGVYYWDPIWLGGNG